MSNQRRTPHLIRDLPPEFETPDLPGAAVPSREGRRDPKKDRPTGRDRPVREMGGSGT